jgi:hypothetical protein
VIKKNKQKCLVFSFIKLENRSRRVEQILPRGGGTGGREEEEGKSYRRVHVCK